MAVKTVIVPEIGEITLAKRRGARYIRLSVTPSGKIRVGMPSWTPYAAGLAFAKARSDWIAQQLSALPVNSVQDGSKIGKAHRLHIHPAKGKSKITARITATTVDIYTNSPLSSNEVQSKIRAASEKALQKEAATLLPQRLRVLATKHGYSYKTVRIRKLTSRWGSCSTDKTITLSYYLIQLPWSMIDYVLIHELVHTRHMNHGTGFWNAMKEALPSPKTLQKEIRTYRPMVSVD